MTQTPPRTPDPEPITLRPGEGEQLVVVGDRIRVLADGAATHGRCFIFEETSEPGMGPPLHRHAVDTEFFFILEGTYKFVLNGKEFIGEPGAFVCAPRGSLHTFCNCGTTRGRMLLVCMPAGLEGPFRATAAAKGPLTPEDLARIFGAFGLTFEGPPLAC